MIKIAYLYKITNLVNNKNYIGITLNPRRRWNEHKRGGKCVKLRQAFLKYGVDNFKFEVICIGQDEYITDLEMKAITAYDSVENGYNIYYKDKRDKLTTGPRPSDKPVYVSGFWFTSRRVAIQSLNMPPETYSWRKKTGLLGDVEFKRKEYHTKDPVYVGGFWFPSQRCALKHLGIREYNLKRRIEEGFTDQENPNFSVWSKREGKHNGVQH